MDITQVKAYRDYAEKIYPTLIREVFHGFPSAQIARNLMGIKGKAILTQVFIDLLVKRWNCSFEPESMIDMVPNVIEVAHAKVDGQWCPTTFEASYLAELRRTGQDPQDMPFESQLFDLIRDALKQKLEQAVWNAVETDTPAAGDDIMILFDGWHKTIADSVTAGTLTPVTTGALDATNAYDQIEAVLAELNPTVLNAPIDVTLSSADKMKVIQSYRKQYGSTAFAFSNPDGSTKIDGFANVNMHFLPGAKAGTILATPKNNLAYAYDSANDATWIKMESNKRKIDWWMDFKVGAGIALIKDGVIAVNEAH